MGKTIIDSPQEMVELVPSSRKIVSPLQEDTLDQKGTDNNLFGVPMWAFGVAETAELVGIYILEKLKKFSTLKMSSSLEMMAWL